MLVPISRNGELFLVKVCTNSQHICLPKVLCLSVFLAFFIFKTFGKAFFQVLNFLAFKFLEWNLMAGNDYTIN